MKTDKRPKRSQDRDLFVLDFVQFVSAPQSHAKRAAKVHKLMRRCPGNLTEEHWLKLWRGFYYVVWYEEMRKGGEELIEEMGTFDNSSFLLSGFRALTESWDSIDDYRVDKYMFLTRVMLRTLIRKQIESIRNDQTLFEDNVFMVTHSKRFLQPSTKLIQEEQKINDQIEMKANVMDYILSVTNRSIGLFLHLCDIYLEELTQVIQETFDDENEEKKSQMYYEIIIPLAKWLALVGDHRTRNSIHDNIFTRLINETLVNESIPIRISILEKLVPSILKISSHTSCGYNRNSLYRISEEYNSKLSALKGESAGGLRLKRKIIGFDRKRKRARYEITSSTPFVRSIVPLPVL